MKTENRRKPVDRRHQERRASSGLLPDFQTLIEDGVQGVLIHSNFRPLYANQALAALFGYDSAEQILALPLIRPLVPADHWPRVEEEYRQLLRSEQRQVVGRARGVRRDGTEIWLAVTQQVIDWHGSPAIYLTAADISAQAKFEQAMLDNEQRLRAMLEILPVAVYIARWDDGKILFVNRKTCLLFQQSASTLLKTSAATFIADPQDRDNVRQLLQTVHDVRDIEVPMRTAQGRDFVAEIAAIMIHYAGTPTVLVAVNDVTQRKQLEARLLQQANTDELTGIDNRRHFFNQAEQEIRRARRFGRTVSVMMIDLDHFKKINDTLGHAVGDLVLQEVVKAIRQCLRETDIVGRLGGEEFAALLPETGLEAASEVANRMAQAIANHPIVTAKATVPCTVSIGLAHMKPDETALDVMLQRADEALYRAKHNGRNRVEVAT
jgi:diguanylate cyclase (GGDEF)-like protein/PAS domain S-box-containing protein